MAPIVTRHDAALYQRHRNYLAMDPKHQMTAFVRQAAGLLRRDASESVTLTRQLEAFWRSVFRVKRQPLTGRRLVPKDTETPPWAETYRYAVYDHVGAAALLKAYNERLPRVSAVATEQTGRIWGYGTSMGWTERERMQSSLTGVALPTEQDAAADRILEERVDATIALGDAEMATTGLLNNAYVPLVVLPVGAGGSVYWHAKTGKEVLYDLDLCYETVRSQSQWTEEPTTLVLPPRAHAHVRTTPWSNYSDVSILEYWLKSHKQVEVVEEWSRLNTAGAGSTPRLVMYAQTPDHLRAIIPLEKTLLPMQQQGFEYSIPVHLRVGGVEWLYPLSGVYADGFFDPAQL